MRPDLMNSQAARFLKISQVERQKLRRLLIQNVNEDVLFVGIEAFENRGGIGRKFAIAIAHVKAAIFLKCRQAIAAASRALRIVISVFLGFVAWIRFVTAVGLCG